jgi:hypothetical protein
MTFGSIADATGLNGVLPLTWHRYV